MKEIFKFKTAWNYDHRQAPAEYNSPIDETVQDDSYSVQELMQKHARGLNLDIYRRGTYDEHASIDDEPITAIDLTDIDDIKRQLKTEKQLIKDNAANKVEEAKLQSVADSTNKASQSEQKPIESATD